MTLSPSDAARRAFLVEQFNRAVDQFGATDPGAVFFANRILAIDEREAAQGKARLATASSSARIEP